MSWLTTVDHKRIGILYTVTGVLFFFVGGIEALFMRTQLALPANTVLGGDWFNQILTMHGTTMVFMAVMPINVGLGQLHHPHHARRTRHGVSAPQCHELLAVPVRQLADDG